MKLKSQEMRKLAPELDPLRIGTGWKKEDLGKVQVMVESTYGDSHPGSGHLNILVEEVRKALQKKVDLEHVTIVQISATVKVREQTESTTVWRAVR